jgi:hypothetical protein
MPSFVESLETAAKLSALVRGNMEGIATATQSIAGISVGTPATLTIGGDGGSGSGSGVTYGPGGGGGSATRIGMGGSGGGGGTGITYGNGGATAAMLGYVSKDAQFIATTVTGAIAQLARELRGDGGAGFRMGGGFG